MSYSKFFVIPLFAVLSACGGGGGGSTNTATSNSTSAGFFSITSDGVSCAPSGATVSISGTINYERVPFNTTLGGGLDYNSIRSMPVRGAEIQALGSGNCVMASSVTSATGTYSLTVSADSNVKIRVKAKTQSTSGAIWDFEVRDNTSSNALYVIDGSSTDSGSSNSVRNLTASSGWTGSSYGSSRSAAPFAILDSIYDAIQKIVAVDSTVNMDDADIFWSVNNSTASGTLANGEIGASFYNNDQIYLLGAENSDTDEYDEHVVIHEWGHYLEDNLSRADTIGGSHATTDRLDMRVALSEGFSTAFAAMVKDDPIYRDSFGSVQIRDFVINAESHGTSNTGWFNENSVAAVLYDIYDSAADGVDVVSLGFAPIYSALRSTAYRGQAGMTSIFSLVHQIKTDNPSAVTGINAILTSESINANTDYLGSNETNNGGDTNNLPVYTVLADDGLTSAKSICSNNTNNESNKLGNRQFILLSVSSAGSHNVTVTKASGPTTVNYTLNTYLNGQPYTSNSGSFVAGLILTGLNLNVDDYIIEIFDTTNTDGSSSTGGTVCFYVSVS